MSLVDIYTLECGVLEILPVLLCTEQHGGLINITLMSLSLHIPTEIDSSNLSFDESVLEPGRLGL